MIGFQLSYLWFPMFSFISHRKNYRYITDIHIAYLSGALEENVYLEIC